jgi:hypothetical protein
MQADNFANRGLIFDDQRSPARKRRLRWRSHAANYR